MHIYKTKKLVFVMTLLNLHLQPFAQPLIEWQRCIGSSGNEFFGLEATLHQAYDGGTFLFTSSQANDGDITCYLGDLDVSIVKINQNGLIEWQECYGGSNWEQAHTNSSPSLDEGFIFTAQTQSNDGDVGCSFETGRAWLVKTNNFGIIDWENCWEGKRISKIMTTDNGGFVLFGTANYDNNGITDCWVAITDSNGIVQQEGTFGGSQEEITGGYGIKGNIETSNDGGYFLCSSTSSDDGDVSGFHGGGVEGISYYGDVWVVKLNTNLNIEWQRCLGGSSDEILKGAKKTQDGGLIVAAEVLSNDGDVSGNHGGMDAWLAKIDESGNLLWQRCLGGSADEEIVGFEILPEGGAILLARTTSNDGDVDFNHGSLDFWLVKIDEMGEVLWDKCLGGSEGDEAWDLKLTSDNSYLITGVTFSNDGSVSGNNGQADGWLAKISSDGNLLWQKCYGGSSLDGFESLILSSSGNLMAKGLTDSNDIDVTGNNGQGDHWVVKFQDDASNTLSYNENNAVIFPNPCTEMTMLSISIEDIGKSYCITNSLGRIIMQGQLNSKQTPVMLSHLAPGLYSLSIENGPTQKLIKQ